MLKPAPLATAVLAGGAILSLQSCRDQPEAPVVRVTGGAVAAGTPEATSVGREILSRGGNAADAAVAVSLALAVTEPGQTGLGGSAVALVRRPGETPVVIHGPDDTPRGTPGSAPRIAAPTLVAVLERLWRNYGSGTLEWRDLVEPAERLAEEGFNLGRLSHRTHVREYPRLVADSALSALFLTESRAIPAEGTVRTRPELASTLRRLAREGPGDLYRGELAHRLTEWTGRRGLPLTGRDLTEASRVGEVAALRGAFRGWTVWTTPEPWGGAAVLRGLELLQTAPEALWRAPEGSRAPWMVEGLLRALTATESDLETWMSTLSPLPVPSDAAGGWAGPAPGATGGAPRAPGGGSTPRRGGGLPDADAVPGETTHFSVLDERGGAVSLTQTLGGPFGSGFAPPALGFVLGTPPVRAAASPPAEPADSASAGPDTTAPTPEPSPTFPPVRRWASPTIVTLGDSMTLVLGSPGGPRGISAVVQVVTEWVRAPLELREAVSAPRMHVGPVPGGRRGRVYLEGLLADAADSTLLRAPPPWSDSLRTSLSLRGFLITERDTGLQFQGLSPWFGGVNAVARVGTRWLAAADPRRDGADARVSETLPGPDAEGRGGSGGGRLPPDP
ncbi:MAG: gamma-glutamyltransferase [Gemmatimonadota bacterium]|jgi:gamma-glutamyltranspeptidase/glutathione hydrolase